LTIIHITIQKIKIIDISGLTLKEFSSKNQIDLEGFRAGLYFVQLMNYSGLVTNHKIIKI